MKHCILFVVFLMIDLTSINAQCPGAYTCESSQVFCSLEQLDGFRCATKNIAITTFPNPTLCWGQGTPHNLHWWAFIGNGSSVSLTFYVDIQNCDNRHGIQAGAFEGDCTGRRIWDCDASCSPTFSLMGETKACETYYVWVDGCNEDKCDYAVAVTGKDSLQELPEIDTFLQSGSVCACNTIEVCLPDSFACMAQFDWTVDGVEIESHDPCLQIEVPQNAALGDSIEVCLRAGIGNLLFPAGVCDQDSFCTKYAILPVGVVQDPCEIICYEDIPLMWRGIEVNSSCISPPCSIRVPDPDNCCTDYLKSIIVMPPPKIAFRDTFICDTGIAFVAENGVAYTDEVCNELIEFKRNIVDTSCTADIAMCDTSYYLNVGRFKYESNPNVDCALCSGQVTVTANVEFVPDCRFYHGRVGVILNWYCALSGDRLGVTHGGGSVYVQGPKRVCADIEVNYIGQTSCYIMPSICIDIPDSLFPSTPKLTGKEFICNKDSAYYEMDPRLNVCDYIWTVPEGNGQILTPNSWDSARIRVDWSSRQGGFGKVCVLRREDCGETDTCMLVFFDSTEVFKPDTLQLCLGDSISLHHTESLTNTSWSNGESSDTIVVKQGGEYCLTGQPKNSSCPIEKCFYINEISVSVTDTFIENEWAPFKGRIEPVLQTNDSIIDILWSNGATTLNIDGLQAGVYTLVVTTQQGCKFTFAFEVKMTTNTQEENDQPFYIAPNPSSVLSIYPLNLRGEITSIQIHSLDGRMMQNLELDDQSYSTQRLHSGVYWIHIQRLNGASQWLKWVKVSR